MKIVMLIISSYFFKNLTCFSFRHKDLKKYFDLMRVSFNKSPDHHYQLGITSRIGITLEIIPNVFKWLIVSIL